MGGSHYGIIEAMEVWTSLSTLHFDECSFRRQSEFKEFTDHVLARRDKTLPLHKLIFITNRFSSSMLDKNLLDYAMSNTLSHLQLCFPEGFIKIDPVLNSLPMSLRVLKLSAKRYGLTKIETPFCLPKLEILRLQRFVLGPNLLSKCENLVELRVVRCSIKEKVTLSAPRLASLTISYICQSGNAAIMLMVPKLALFKFKAGRDEIPVILTDEFLHLKTAILKTGEKIQRQESMMNMLQKLSHAQYLSLSLPTLQLLHQIGRALKVPVSPFSNVKTK